MQPQTLGPYRLGEQIGRGGMGTVYAAEHVESGEVVAVKVLATALGHDEAFRERFALEIEALKKLRHENIVCLLGYGEYEGVLYYVMELVEGTSLEEELRVRQFTWPEVKEIGVQLCAALTHAHDRGVTHRDLKPANLLITEEGQVKLSDFGISKLFGEPGVTSDKGIVGTAEYMAPEQADGRPVGHRCDLYSLGAVLYALLAGRPPFVAKSIPEVLQMQRFAEPEPVRRWAPDVPAEVEAIVMQLLEKDPQRRPSNARLVSRQIEATFLGLERRKKNAANDDAEFELSEDAASPPDGETVDRPQLGQPKTRAVGQTRFATGSSVSGDVDFDSATLVTGAMKKLEEAESGGVAEEAQPPAEVQPVSIFTTVDELAAEEREDDTYNPWVSPATLLWTSCLLAFGLVVYYFLQPPAADALYTRVMESVNSGGDTGLLSAEEDIRSFLQYYSTDKRSREMEDMLDDIALVELEQQLERRARRRGNGLSLVEIAYLEAMDQRTSDPPRCLRELEALINLYEGGPAAPSARSRQCLKLAQKQIAQLEQPVKDYQQRHGQLIQQRLARAQAIETDQPDAARQIRQAIVNLYTGKPWAEKMVKQANEALRD